MPGKGKERETVGRSSGESSSARVKATTRVHQAQGSSDAPGPSKEGSMSASGSKAEINQDLATKDEVNGALEYVNEISTYTTKVRRRIAQARLEVETMYDELMRLRKVKRIQSARRKRVESFVENYQREPRKLPYEALWGAQNGEVIVNTRAKERDHHNELWMSEQQLKDWGVDVSQIPDLKTWKKETKRRREEEETGGRAKRQRVELLEGVFALFLACWQVICDDHRAIALVSKKPTRSRQTPCAVQNSMSKSSTGTSAKPLPAKSAWSKGPPQTSAPSPRSQSPAPSAQSQSHLTHSRRPSALGQAVPIKDGVSIPRSNVGAAAAKQGSPVTFGSIDDASAPISSSPAAPNPIKESVVKSFGTVPAAPATASSHINGKASISVARSASVSVNSPSSSASTSSATPSAPSTISSGPKLQKPDIKKLFQSPSAPAATAADTQSPSLRSATLPSQQHPQNPPSSSQPQFGSHFRTFVPGGQPGPSSGPNPSRSPVYQRAMPNGSGPRSQPPNGGATGLSSPRLGPPHTPQQTAGPQPPAPVPGQVPPQYAWPGYYYPPEYMGYPQWGYVPGMPQPAHPHGPHPGHPPHAPPHSTMPMSPRNAPQHLPATPTMSHAAPNPVHPPHPPPPLSHTTSSISSVSSPPPTPSSSARLNASSSAFVPRPTSKIVLKNPDGKEVNLEALKQNAASPATTAPPSGQGSPFRGSSPSTPKRASVRIETEEQRKKRLAEEEEKEKEKQRQQAEAEAKAKKAKEEEERKAKEEEERKKRGTVWRGGAAIV
ncbi:hypothetical protein NMY22_g4691 [Coprinellus aureogranulatus]|nr:hypothetical protein NMY22_g4691 [Coprinellus aureogranulatus]